jgi:excisionase family DNA binding protein
MRRPRAGGVRWESTYLAPFSVTLAPMAKMNTFDTAAQQWMSVKEAAPFLGVSERTVRRLVAAREVGHYVVGSQIRIAMADVDRYLARTRVNAIS